MNRCLSFPHLLARRWVRSGAAGAALVVCLHGAAVAQDASPQPRHFPERVQSASLSVGNAPDILINAAPDRLAPGARIHDTSNRLVTPTSLGNQVYWVHYLREPNGMVHEVWILTPHEAALARAAPKKVW